MDHFPKSLLAALLLACMLLALCGCDTPPAQTEPTPAPTQAPARLPAPGAERLFLEGEELGPVCELDGLRYFLLEPLAERVSALELTETGAGSLRLTLRPAAADTSLSMNLLAGSDTVKVPWKQEALSLGAPLLRGPEGWYLPLTAAESLLGYRCLHDAEAGAWSLLALEGSPVIRGAEGETLSCLRCGGELLLPAEALARLSGAALEADVDTDGSLLLSVKMGERVLRCRADAPTAELDGEALELSAPAWLREEQWYLPVEAAEAMGLLLASDEAGQEPRLIRAEAGAPVWFDGRALGPSLELEGSPCVRLSTLAERLGGSLSRRGNSIILKAGGRELRFRPGESVFQAELRQCSLSRPLTELNGEWLAPVRSLAEAMGLRELEDGQGLVFSGMEPRQTVLYIDGHATPAYGLADGTLYLRLSETEALQLGEGEQEGEQLVSFRGRSAALRGEELIFPTADEGVSGSAPVYADGAERYVPAAELLQALGLTELRDPELDQIYYTYIVRHDELPEGVKVPVFMYHAVGDQLLGEASLFVSPREMEKQLQFIVDEGYTPITFEDLDHVDEIEKPVLLTFDDGYIDNYTALFPLLQKYQLRCTVFVIPDMIGGFYKMDKAQIKELSDSGLVSIQSHTMSHSFLSSQGQKQLVHEHYDSMLEIARITGKQPFVLCYPTGKSSEASRAVTAQYYEYGLCMSGPCWVTGQGDPYLIYRYFIPRGLYMARFQMYLDGQ